MKKGPLRVLLATFIFAAPAFASATTLYHQSDHSQLVYTAPTSYQNAGYWAALNLPVVATGQPLYWWLNAKLPQQDTVLSFNAPNTSPSCTVRFEQTPTPGWVRAYAHPFCTTGSGARADLPTFSADSIIRVGVLGSLGPGGELYGGGMPPAGSQSCRDEQTGNDACAAPPALFITDDANTVPEPLVPLPPNDTGTHLIGTYYQGYYFSLAGSPYVIDGPVYIRSGAVTVEPGVVVKFRNAASSLSIHSETQTTFSATPGSPIYFTSYKDDTHGGDTNGDGGATSPAPGDWGHLSLGCDQPHIYDHIHVLYGGALAAGGDAALYLCSPRNFFTLYTIRHIEVAYSMGGLVLMNGGSTAWVTDSSFHDNVNFAIRTEAAPFVPWSNTFIGNWWGSPTGPQASDNPGGTGDRMLGSGVTVPFLTEDPFPSVPPPPTTCTPGVDSDCNSSVLFLPGLEASRLYDTDNGETRLWEPGSDADAMQLAMTSHGGSTRADIYTRDVLDEAYAPEAGPNVYKSFIGGMNDLKAAGKIADWKAAAYDWRLSLEDVITHGKDIGGNISYLTATDTPYIEQELRRLARESRTGKVTIIAHSNGGLVAKALMQKLGASTTAALIDKVIFVASPQVGTPQAVGAILHGYEQGLPKDWLPFLLHPETARDIARDMPGVYGLLPSSNYFAYVNDPVIDFDDSALLALWRGEYGGKIDSAERLAAFMTDAARAPLRVAETIKDPSVANPTLLSAAGTTHQAGVDQWSPPAGVRVIEIAGWGEDTLKTIHYYQGVDGTCALYRPDHTCAQLTSTPALDYKPILTVDGDGTVVAPSALWTTGSERYWVNLKNYNDGFVGTTIDCMHADLFEVPGLNTLLQNLIVGAVPIDHENEIVIFNTMPSAQPTDERLHFTLHSPLSLDLYDHLGNHTGYSTTTGRIETNIPGSRFKVFGGVTYATAPASTTIQVIMRGFASGSFTLDVEETRGDSITASTTFAGIPTSDVTIATITIPQNTSIASSTGLFVDENGDGNPDMHLAPEDGGVALPDITPPEAVFSFSTTTDDVLVSDSNEGTVTVAPVSELSTSTLVYTLADQSGNTTTLTFQRIKEKESKNERHGHVKAKLLSIRYATLSTSTEHTLPKNEIQYEWERDKAGVLKKLEQEVAVKKDFTLRATYDGKKNETKIYFADKNSKEKLKEVRSGLVLVRIVTRDGRVEVEY